MTSAVPEGQGTTIAISQSQFGTFSPIGRTAIQSQLCVKYQN